MNTGATFSPDRVYRYRLWRYWDINKPGCMFVLLNPSTADETTNDPTVERCQRRAEMWGWGGIEVVNIFALRSTNPKMLYTADDPVGPDNDEAIWDVLGNVELVVCGWGKHGKLLGRGEEVLDLLSNCHIKPHALKVNKDGTPAHPLYLSYKLLPKPM